MTEFREITADQFFDALNDNGYTARDELLDIVEKYGWHPASEPPEEEGWYLVTCDIEEGWSLRGVDVCEYNPLKISGDHWQWNGVVAWMPIPEPYQPKGE